MTEGNEPGHLLFYKCIIYETIIADIVSCPFIIHSSCILSQLFYEPYAGQTQWKTNTVFQFVSPVLVVPLPSSQDCVLLPKSGF